MRKEPSWIRIETVLHVHRELTRTYGGPPAVRDLGLLDSGLNRPKNLWVYSQPSIFDLAASYAVGICHNHPFLDGNKRTAFVVAVLFLELNGEEFQATETEAAVTFIHLANNEISEHELSLWFKDNCLP